MALTAYSTGDVSLDLLRGLATDLRPHLELQVDEHQRFFKSLEPPSFVSFLANAPWWLQAFGAYSALYVAELVREAAKDTWKSRAKIASKIHTVSGAPLRLFSGALSRIRIHLKPHASLSIGLPIPDDSFGAQLHLEGSEQHLIEAQIALFVHHLPGLVKLIESEHLDSGRAFGPIQLRLLADGSLQVGWLDPKTETECQRILPLDAT